MKKRSKSFYSRIGKMGADALNKDTEKKAIASRKAAETRGYESLAAAGRKGGLAYKKPPKKEEK
jgi:hypothetical protein